MICTAIGCNAKAKTSGLCGKHYQRRRLCGDENKRTKFDKNEVVIFPDRAVVKLYDSFGVDKGEAVLDVDSVKLVRDLKWSLNSNGYAMNANNIYMHRIIMPSSECVCHLNGDKLDNRIANLVGGDQFFKYSDYDQDFLMDGDECYFTVRRKNSDVRVIIDSDNVDIVRGARWHVTSHGYVRSSGGYLHHLIVGRAREGSVIDHINRNKLDNRMINLRIVSYHGNACNISFRKGRKFKGVSYDKSRNKWIASIMSKGVQYNLGRFDDIEVAAKAYNDAALRLHGEVASLNDI